MNKISHSSGLDLTERALQYWKACFRIVASLPNTSESLAFQGLHKSRVLLEQRFLWFVNGIIKVKYFSSSSGTMPYTLKCAKQAFSDCIIETFINSPNHAERHIRQLNQINSRIGDSKADANHMPLFPLSHKARRRTISGILSVRPFSSVSGESWPFLQKLDIGCLAHKMRCGGNNPDTSLLEHGQHEMRVSKSTRAVVNMGYMGVESAK